MPTFEKITVPKDRLEWLALRKAGVGSSDSAAACGVHPYMTPLELYTEKLGPPEDIDNKAMYWGRVLEDVVAREFCLGTGWKVQKSNFVLKSIDHPHMLANLDRVIVGQGKGPGILEIKTAGQFMANEWGPDGSDEVPEEYIIQVQHQFAVTGYDWGVLAVLIGGRDYRTYPMRRNEDMIEDIIALTQEFWGHVVSGEPPEIDFEHGRVLDLIKKLYPGTNGHVIDFGLEPMSWHERLQQVKSEAKALSQEESKLKALLLNEMGESSVGRFPDGSGYTRKVVQRSAYTVEPKPYVDFRYTKKIKGVAR